ncbi:MAG: CHASE2 domain-containing protein, partial [Candidatus Marinimicrobia bacterium]|nr:CHASE2 domain-containing protein [Candidatus Neomarinimicrobiota bacterium]
DYMELWKENSIYPQEILDMLRGEGGNESPFKDKIVLIGDALEEHFDLKFTPFFNYLGEPKLTAGVETHANAAQTILDANYITKTNPKTNNMIVFLLTLVTLIGSLVFGPILGVISLIVIISAYLLSSIWLFTHLNIWIEWLAPVAGALGAYGLNTLYDFILEQREKKKIRGMFSTYMSPKILKYLEDHPDAFRLTGEKRSSSIFFSDVEGFTTISESLSAEELALVLNKYLSPMTDILMSYEGYVDKYEGDAIMCDFGVPVEDLEHAWKACWAALEQQERLVSLREEIKRDHNVTIKVRMGINSGMVSAGNMGSDQRFQYTVMGDAVNAASRFESANKQYGTYMMIGQNTYNDAKDYIEVRYLDRIIVKGKNEYITVYNLLAKKGELSDEYEGLRKYFDAAMELYWDRKFDEAITSFKKGMEFVPDDPPSKVFIGRCEAFLQTPPPENWQGEFIMTTK